MGQVDKGAAGAADWLPSFKVYPPDSVCLKNTYFCPPDAQTKLIQLRSYFYWIPILIISQSKVPPLEGLLPLPSTTPAVAGWLSGSWWAGARTAQLPRLSLPAIKELRLSSQLGPVTPQLVPWPASSGSTSSAPVSWSRSLSLTGTHHFLWFILRICQSQR